MEALWDELEEHLQVIHGNLGVCCQEYCDAPNAIYSLERVMNILATIRENGTV